MRAVERIAVGLSDGATLTLRADINALCLFEGEMVRAGLDPVVELAKLEAGARGTIMALRALVWACAQGAHPRLTPAAVGDMLTTDGEALRDGLSRALAQAMPVPDPDAPPPGKTQAPPA